jgi:TATA-box binding protein (TBP) (component of TFIID and TFIIIB)
MTINVDPDEVFSRSKVNFVARFNGDEGGHVAALNSRSSYHFVRQDYKRMKNCVVLKTTKSSSGGNVKVLKIFNNARVQMNGLKSEEDVVRMVHLYRELLRIVFQSPNVSVSPPRASMINGKFQIGLTLDLSALFDECVASGLSVVYNSEVHPGLRFTSGSATVFVFSSGKALVMGSKCAGDIVNGFHTIMRIISDNTAKVYLDPSLLVGKKEIVL